MLKVWYREGDIKVLRNAPNYFNNVKKAEWFSDPLVIEMIKDVDKSDVVGPNLIQSPVLGPIAPTLLSGGVKVLILMLKDERFMYNISNCGDNCVKWILEIGKRKDIIVYLGHWMDFTGEFEIQIMNSGHIIHNAQEYCHELLEIDSSLDGKDFEDFKIKFI